MKINVLSQLLAVAVFAASCSGTGTQKTARTAAEIPAKHQISKNLHGQAPLRSQQFRINASKGEHILTPDGARILIPAGIFTDASGRIVEGTVTVNYKSMQSMEEIIASGIPMQAFDGKRNGQFISDGMFEITATAGGAPLKITEGRALQVYTPVRDEASDFKYWYFNTEKGMWEETGSRAQLTSEKDIATAAGGAGLSAKEGITAYNLKWKSGNTSLFRFANETEPQTEITPGKIIPGKYNPKKMTLDLDFNPDVYPDLAVYSGLMWQYAGKSSAMDPENNKWIFQDEWTHVDLNPSKSGDGTFDLVIHIGSSIYKTVVRPVVTGKDALLAEKNYAEEIEKMKKMQQEIAARGATEKQISENMYSAFQVSQMGTYNCDRFYSDPDAVDFTASFETEGHELSHGETVYVLTDRKSRVLQYSAGSTIRINPDVVDAIFVVATQGAIAAVGAESLAGFKSKRGGQVRFKMKKINIRISGLESLRSAINSL